MLNGAPAFIDPSYHDLALAGAEFLAIIDQRCRRDPAELTNEVEAIVWPKAVALADALASWEPILSDPGHALPLRFDRGLKSLKARFSEIIDRWGWRQAIGPGRDAYGEACRQRHRDTVERPFFEAVVSFATGDAFPDHADGYAWLEEASRLGIGATMTPEEAESIIDERLGRYHRGPILGRSPAVCTSEDIVTIDGALLQIESYLNWSAPSRPKQTPPSFILDCIVKYVESDVDRILSGAEKTLSGFCSIRERQRIWGRSIGQNQHAVARDFAPDRELIGIIRNLGLDVQKLDRPFTLTIKRTEGEAESLAPQCFQDCLADLSMLFAEIEKQGREPNGMFPEIGDERVARLGDVVERLRKLANESNGPPPPSNFDRPEPVDIPTTKAQPSLSSDHLEMIEIASNLRRAGRNKRAALIELMSDRNSVSFNEVGRHVHDDPDASDGTIRQNVNRANEDLVEAGSTIRLKVASGAVHKIISRR